jgi:hypothetical protein
MMSTRRLRRWITVVGLAATSALACTGDIGGEDEGKAGAMGAVGQGGMPAGTGASAGTSGAAGSDGTGVAGAMAPAGTGGLGGVKGAAGATGGSSAPVGGTGGPGGAKGAAGATGGNSAPVGGTGGPGGAKGAAGATGGSSAPVAGTSGGQAGSPGGAPVAVAVGYGRRRLRTMDAKTWTMQESTANGGDDNDLFRGVTWGNGNFVAVGGSSVSLTMTSADGQTWTTGTGTTGDWLGGVAWNGTVFVAAGGNGRRVRSTDNGATWTNSSGYKSQSIHYRAVAFGAGQVVAVGHTYSESPNVGVISTSPDGQVWTERRHTGAPFGTIAFGNGLFVASAEKGAIVTSADGITWTERTVGAGTGAVIFTGTAFVLRRDGGLYTSTDGAQWTMASSDNREVLGYFNGNYLSFGWPLNVTISSDLKKWSTVFDPKGSGLTGVAVGTLPPSP